ncbi:prepilin-type N-terminal cleavage/methylation domain-containing protein [Sulfurivirga caldicuralii]|uniref:Prepilin-type N-terminal cleavage/methylation domain-containing protein n=1 Tax=Sulfurivirga caldicuralii TaxID=364032 RepID=A0A1N6DIZ4_9GAMM|nr:prepilin-type N-terminal cleavage/methylation domain-containing protein [Sulfurivirga caldicuralii]SIN70750.1 prepilin-type N-terminal cleavage/methylation domain-containing protein [Sulfurivirga caldicuralii]
MTMRKKEQGFTLVEVAIVLVIIGLLLGGVLKGQELMKSAKVKGEAQLLQSYQTAYFGFIDRYGAMPGDMNSGIPANWNITGGNGNGTINGGVCDNDDDESCKAIRMLRAANFLNGDPAEAQPQPKDKLANAPMSLFSSTVANQTGVWVYVNGNVDPELLNILDRQIDDGKCSSGSMISQNTTNANFCDATTGEYLRAQRYYYRIN